MALLMMIVRMLFDGVCYRSLMGDKRGNESILVLEWDYAGMYIISYMNYCYDYHYHYYYYYNYYHY